MLVKCAWYSTSTNVFLSSGTTEQEENLCVVLSGAPTRAVRHKRSMAPGQILQMSSTNDANRYPQPLAVHQAAEWFECLPVHLLIACPQVPQLYHLLSDFQSSKLLSTV